MNLVSLTINGIEVSKAETIAPKTFIHINNNDKSKKLFFNFINDYGIQIKNIQCNFV
ncbi:hypothetical protein AB6G14_05295 [Providencia hangzhouensis]|uniref:hypothetical protein n=1 Tax=Providencia hangzhouensis TaxID=3031799 RepID=UPI0034DD4E6B